MPSNSNYNKKLRGYARENRNKATKAEACLWKYALRAGQMNGYKFRRQRPVGYFIADFMCLELRLVIEVDGITHLDEKVKRKDIIKQDWLEVNGYTVVRYTDDQVLSRMESVKRHLAWVIGKLNIKN